MTKRFSKAAYSLYTAKENLSFVTKNAREAFFTEGSGKGSVLRKGLRKGGVLHGGATPVRHYD